MQILAGSVTSLTNNDTAESSNERTTLRLSQQLDHLHCKCKQNAPTYLSGETCTHELRTSTKPQSVCVTMTLHSEWWEQMLITTSTIHHLTLSHLTVSVQVLGRSQLIVASLRGLGSDVTTLPPSAGLDVAVVTAAAWLLEDRTQSYSSRATHVTNSPHDQSTADTTFLTNAIITCEIKSFWNNFSVLFHMLPRYFSHSGTNTVVTCEITHWNYFKMILATKIISLTLNMLENIHELQ